MKPDYKRIYSDILNKKFPHKKMNVNHYWIKRTYRDWISSNSIKKSSV